MKNEPEKESSSEMMPLSSGERLSHLGLGVGGEGVGVEVPHHWLRAAGAMLIPHTSPAMHANNVACKAGGSHRQRNVDAGSWK